MIATKVAQGQVSGAQRMRARDVGGASGSASPVAPAATDVAAAGVAAGSRGGPAATSLGAAAGRGGSTQPGATAAGYMAASGAKPPPGSVVNSLQSTRQPGTAAAPAAPVNPFRYNPQAQRLETNQISDYEYEAWTGPHDYQGQPVDMKYVLNYADGAASWKPSGELRAHQGS